MYRCATVKMPVVEGYRHDVRPEQGTGSGWRLRLSLVLGHSRSLESRNGTGRLILDPTGGSVKNGLGGVTRDRALTLQRSCPSWETEES